MWDTRFCRLLRRPCLDPLDIRDVRHDPVGRKMNLASVTGGVAPGVDNAGWGRPEIAQKSCDRPTLARSRPSMKKTSGVVLMFVGILVGCGAAAVAPTAISNAQPRQGAWGCYVADRFPDVRAAADWSGSVGVKQGLDQVAPN